MTELALNRDLLRCGSRRLSPPYFKYASESRLPAPRISSIESNLMTGGPAAGRGFSLIETVIAIGVVGVSILAVMALSGSLPLSRVTGEESVALSIAHSELERVRAGGYDAVPASGPWDDQLLSSLPRSTATLAVSDWSDTVKEITASVSWRDARDGATRSVSLSTLIAKVGGLP